LRGSGSWIPTALAIAAVAALFAGGCGEQDLYKPPHAPWQVVGRVALPSINEDVSMLGEYAYVAGGEAGMHVVDVRDPSHPVLISTINTTKYAQAIRAAAVPTDAGIISIAFVVEGTEGITTYNISNPDSAYSFQQGTTATDGNTCDVEVPTNPDEPVIIYLAENWKGMRIFEVSRTLPGQIDYNGVFAPTRGYAKGVAVADGYAYVADDEMGLAVIDVRVRTLGIVKLVSATDTPGKALGVDVKGGYAFVADGPDGLVVMRINLGDPPVIVGRLGLPGTCRAVVVRDNTAFLAAQDGGIHVVDVTNPADPKLLGSISTTYATGVAVSTSGTVVASDRVDGLLVLSGGGSFHDTVPPAKVSDLGATMVSASKIRLDWHATGNDQFTGTAGQYDFRYSSSPITDDNWDGCTQSADEPTPAKAGTAQFYKIVGLQTDTRYYFAMKAGDAAGNWSAMSNVATAVTAAGNVPPILVGGYLTPTRGAADETLFTYAVTFEDGDGEAPSQRQVVIDGIPHDMDMNTNDYENGALYRYQTTLPLGDHVYYFAFDDGHSHPVQTEPVVGPYFGVSFTMGSPVGETYRDADETLHEVVLSRQIHVEDHEVTQAEYVAVMATNPSHFLGDSRPVENVTWYDAIAYCNARSVGDGLAPAYQINGPDITWNRDANGWRLPTEAEWEFACRGGTASLFYSGSTSDTLLACAIDAQGDPDPVVDPIAWYCGNSDSSGTHDVRLKGANSAGLYDMAGNVWEWCWDWYGPLGTDIVLDPAGPASGVERVRRGGSWYHYSRYCRSASRDAYYPNSKDDVLGFRVVKNLD
jgi:formylglycine-generating enzyme required for sulfatase activity